MGEKISFDAFMEMNIFVGRFNTIGLFINKPHS